MNEEVFEFDVNIYSTLIDAQVQIECLDQRKYSGRVYTVDPLTQSIVLIDETSHRVHIVLRPDILQLTIVERLQPGKDPFVISDDVVQQQDSNATDRLIKIRSFLSSKRIPFQEKTESNGAMILLIHNGVVQIHTPYTFNSVSGTNEIVLSRIKQLLKQISL